MNRLLALTLLLAGCQSGPIAHDAPIRLFNPDIPTPDGRPHPGWTPALRERMARERQLNPTQTPMDREADYVTRPMRVPVGVERDVLLWKPKQ